MKKLWMIAPLLLAAACAPSRSVKMDHALTVKETEKVKSKYTGPKRRIGVVEFENKSAYGQGRLGGAASDILITELVKSGKFIVVERDRMTRIMEEQKMQSQGTVDPQTAVKLGKIMGLEAIVVGAVSQFGVNKQGSDYLIRQTKQQVADVTVDIRLIDVQSGQVLMADSGKGQAKSKSGSFLGMGTKGGYDETLEGEALRGAIVKFVDNIANQMNAKPWSCRIADAYDQDIYLNAGQESGMKTGMVLSCFSQGAEIRDPRSNLVIGHRETYLGDVEIDRWCGESGDCSVAKLVKRGSASPKGGDICRLAK
ncbi:MAG TPA: CsgG/HfaB family protein [Elusimicrobiales bacterium]|nr:CsgG/HfaB family protein [Elusimicrobiales bacterium]